MTKFHASVSCSNLQPGVFAGAVAVPRQLGITAEVRF